MKSDFKWNATKRYIATVLTGILHKKVMILDARPGELGYTGGEGAIYISNTHPLFEKVTMSEKLMMQLGIAVHESLHNIFTNFDYLREKYQSLYRDGCFESGFEANMFLEIFNLIEDPAIEAHAHEKCGGVALRALYFTIEKIDRISGDFQENTIYPFQELFKALVQFGDMGLLHGEFTFPEAQSTFYEIAPIFYEAINEIDNRRRVDMAYDIMLHIRPLWEGCPESEFCKLIEAIREILEQRAKSGGETNLYRNGKGMNWQKTCTDNELNRKRKISIKKVSRDEFEKMKAESESKSQKDDGISDIQIVVPDDMGSNENHDLETDEEPYIGISTECSEDSATEYPDEQDAQDTSMAEDDNTEDSSVSSIDESDEKSEETSQQVNCSEDRVDDGEIQAEQSDGNYTNEGQLLDSVGDMIMQDDDIAPNQSLDNTKDFDMSGKINPYELSEEEQQIIDTDIAIPNFTEEDLESVLAGIEKEEIELKQESEDTGGYYEPIPELTDSIAAQFPQFSNVPAENRYVEDTEDLSEKYEVVVNRLAQYIESLKDDLKDIFIADRVRKEYCESGKVHVPRLVSKKTLNVFRRRIQSDHKNDVCFVIAVDNSGSTSGEKNAQEKIACIGIAEALAEFSIPLYIFGFQTSYTNTEYAVQTHYVRWDNTAFERERLLCMKSDGSNFDSYSIRYATELLKERTERNKVLIVISDGCPSSYFSGYEGIKQNTMAINDARDENIRVLGIGVGNVDEACFEHMYSKDYYIQVSEPKDLFDNISERIIRMINEQE